MPTIADALVARLHHRGVDTIFGVGGTHTVPLLGAIGRQDGLSYVTARTELGAAYMALGYARATGRPAVALTSTGPGALNVTAALQDACWSSVPMVHLTTSIGSDSFAGEVHETPAQHDLLQLAGKACLRLADKGIARTVDRAIELAVSRPRGPVTLEVPAGIWHEAAHDHAGPGAGSEEDSEPDFLDPLAAALGNAARPLFFVGGGAVQDDRGEAVLRLAETVQAPIITSYQGKSIADWHHSLYLGPWASEAAVRDICGDADVAVVFGSKLSALGTAAWQLPLPERTYHVDLADRPHGRYRYLHAIPLDAVQVATELQERLPPKDGWAADRLPHLRADVIASAHARGGAEMSFVDALGSPRLLAVDMTKAGFWVMKYLPAARAVHAFSSYLTMGTALPMAIGMALGRGEPTLAVVGDGALQMSLAELGTVAAHRVPLTIAVIVDGAYGMLRDSSTAAGDTATTGLDLWNPAFAELAAAFGMSCTDVNSSDQLTDLLGQEETGPRMLLVNTHFSRCW